MNIWILICLDMKIKFYYIESIGYLNNYGRVFGFIELFLKNVLIMVT